MKRNIKEIIVFLLVAILIISASASKEHVKLLLLDAVTLFELKEDFPTFTSNIDSEANNQTYHDMLIDIESYVMRLSGKKVVEKDEDVVIRLDNGYLYGPMEKTSDKTLNTYVDCVQDLYNTSLQNDSQFLFVMEPSKGINKTLPLDFDNYTTDNCDSFINALAVRNIPTLNLVESMEAQGISEEKMFFATDHHWKPESGFWAVGLMCSELQKLYGFDYDNRITDINNYDVKVYHDWFLGSQGKKTGRFFTDLGADNISLITPKFKTELIEQQPNKNEVKKGNFSESVLCMENIENNDYYNVNSYAVYSGGDFRLQIITNELSDNNNKVVLIRDSYSCVTVPFLALAVNELHVVDVRDGEWYVGPKINVHDYIEQVKPDYVIVAYNIGAIDEESTCFDFK